MPILFVPIYPGGPPAMGWLFSPEDSIKLRVHFPPVKKRIIETESGKLRSRVRGYRLRATITFERPENAKFIDFMRFFLNKRFGYFYPHPYGLAHANNHALDYWNVIPDSNLDYDYFADRFVGHKGEIILLGQDTDREEPVDITGAIHGSA